MVEESEKPVHWFVRRVVETLLVLGIFMGGFLVREFLPLVVSSGPEDRAAPNDSPLEGPTLEAVKRQTAVSAVAGDGTHTAPANVTMPRQVVAAERRLVPVTVVMHGKVAFDPEGLHTVSAPLSGRVDRVYHGSAGLFVDADEALIQLFCPDTVAAQNALIDAIRAHRETRDSGSGFFGKLKTRQIEEARGTLQRMGLTPGQIDSVAGAATARDHLLFRAPVAGHLTALPVHTGQYVERGDALCTVADLSTVHLVLSASQQDMLWLRYGQTVRFVPEGRKDLAWGGWILSLAAAAEPGTEHWCVYVLALNGQDLLRPGMAVRASVTCQAAGIGQVVDPNRAERWMCSVHPQVVAEHKGVCTQCERALVSGSSQGYISKSAEAELPLVIPGPAVFRRHGQAVVTVQEPNESQQERPLGEIQLIGDYVVVGQGLKEGDQVLIPRDVAAGN